MMVIRPTIKELNLEKQSEEEKIIDFILKKLNSSKDIKNIMDMQYDPSGKIVVTKQFLALNNEMKKRRETIDEINKEIGDKTRSGSKFCDAWCSDSIGEGINGSKNDTRESWADQKKHRNSINHKYFDDYRDDFDKYIKSVNDGKLIKELEKLKKEQSEILEDLYLKKIVLLTDSLMSLKGR